MKYVTLNEEESLMVEQIKTYFKVKYKGKYYNHMKSLACKWLMQKGFSYRNIAEIVFYAKEKTSTVFMITHKVYVDDFTDDWKKCVINLVYPRTVYKNHVRDGYVLVNKHMVHLETLPLKTIYFNETNDHKYYNTEDEMMIPSYSVKDLKGWEAQQV